MPPTSPLADHYLEHVGAILIKTNIWSPVHMCKGFFLRFFCFVLFCFLSIDVSRRFEKPFSALPGPTSHGDAIGSTACVLPCYDCRRNDVAQEIMTLGTARVRQRKR